MPSSYKKTIVLGLDYSEFSGGITECNRKMGLLDAEMKLASEQAKEFGDSSDQLRIKQEGLTQKIELQKKIVEQQAEAYDKAMTKYNGTGKEVDRLDKALLNSRTTLQRYKNELNDVTEQLDNMDEETEEVDETNRSFGDTVREVAETMGVSASPAVEKLASMFDGLNDKVGKTILTVGTIGTTLVNLTMSTAEHAKEIENISQKMGMNVETYQAWDYVMKSVGSDAESMQGDLAALAEKAMDAASGAGEGAELFGKLGIRVKGTGGELKSQVEIFNEVFMALRNMTDETERNAIATALLGTTGENLIPVLNMTATEFNNLVQKGIEVGYVMDSETVSSMANLNDKANELRMTVTGLGQHFAEVLLPPLTVFLTLLSNIPAPVVQAVVVLATAAVTITTLYKAIMSINATAKGVTALFNAISTGADMSYVKIMLVVAGVTALAVAIAALIGKTDEIRSTMDSIGSFSSNVSQPSYHASGTPFFKGGRTWVGENGPEIVELPVGSRIYSNQQSRRMTSGGNIFYVTIDAKNVTDFNRVVQIFAQLQTDMRTGKVVL